MGEKGTREKSTDEVKKWKDQKRWKWLGNRRLFTGLLADPISLLSRGCPVPGPAAAEADGVTPSAGADGSDTLKHEPLSLNGALTSLTDTDRPGLAWSCGQSVSASVSAGPAGSGYSLVPH